MLGLLTVLAAEEVHHENGAILAGDMNEVYWGTVSFVCLMALLWWKAVPAIKTAMKGRTERIRAELEAAEAARTTATGELTAIRTQLSDADGERGRIMAEAKASATSLEAELIARAESDAVAMRERAVRDIEASKAQAMADLQGTVSDLTIGAAEAVVLNSLDAAMQGDLIDRYIEQVGAPS